MILPDYEAEKAALMAANIAQIEEANRRVFTRECERDGIDPARGVSPALLKILGAS